MEAKTSASVETEAADIGGGAVSHKNRSTTQKSKKPKVAESAKLNVLLSSQGAKWEVRKLLSDLHDLRKPLSLNLQKFRSKQFVHLLPFEDCSPIETLCERQNCTLFAVGDSTKKHPFRVVFGRLFDFKLLDMYEFDISNYTSFKDLCKVESPMFGSKPLLILQGSAFESTTVLQHLRNYLSDFFVCADTKKICLQGMDRAIVISALEQPSLQASSVNPSFSNTAANNTLPAPSLTSNVLRFQQFKILLKKSGTKIPRVELQEIGPRFDMKLVRHTLPETERWKMALKQPKLNVRPKVKNIKTDPLGQKLGRVHVGKANYTKLHTPHFHGSSERKRRRTMPLNS